MIRLTGVVSGETISSGGENGSESICDFVIKTPKDFLYFPNGPPPHDTPLCCFAIGAGLSVCVSLFTLQSNNSSYVNPTSSDMRYYLNTRCPLKCHFS